MNLRYATRANFVSRLRERYSESSGLETARLAAKIDTWIKQGDLTVDEVWGRDDTSKARAEQLATDYVRLTAARAEDTSRG